MQTCKTCHMMCQMHVMIRATMCAAAQGGWLRLHNKRMCQWFVGATAGGCATTGHLRSGSGQCTAWTAAAACGLLAESQHMQSCSCGELGSQSQDTPQCLQSHSWHPAMLGECLSRAGERQGLQLATKCPEETCSCRCISWLPCSTQDSSC